MGSSKLRGRRDEKSTKEPPEGHSFQHVPRDGAYTVLITTGGAERSTTDPVHLR